MSENLDRLKKWLDASSYEGIILGRRDNFKWITGENENAVVTNEEVGIGYLLLKKDGSLELLADSSDCPRMSKEQNALNARPILVPWYETLGGFLKQYCAGKNYASDTLISGTVYVQPQMMELRMHLNEQEIKRYREIGQLCAKIVEQTAREARPGQTEKEVAALLKSRCILNGVSPDCVLVGSDERILEYRHPVPTDKVIRNSLMVVLGGEKYGLNISMTRMVYFQPVPEVIRERLDKTQYIFAAMQCIMKTQPSYKDFFEKVTALYAEVGYDGEWKMHHQGGPTGYGCREFVVTPDCPGRIFTGQAYAWNPTIQGTKCEETTILWEDGIEILTRTADWPCRVVRTPYGEFEAADILEV